MVPDRDLVHCPISARATGGHVGCFSVPDWQDPARRAELWTGIQGSLAALAADARTAGSSTWSSRTWPSRVSLRPWP